MIPKIIHQISPKNKKEWHPIWEECQQSWRTNFDDFDHISWNDQEDIDNLVQTKFPEYFNYYNDLPFHIMKIDFSRYCILYEYGGIYADMDIFCYKNFYNDLTEECYLLESLDCTIRDSGEKVQNSLMISSSKNYFFKYCMDETVKKPLPFTRKDITTNFFETDEWMNSSFFIFENTVFEHTGPKRLSEMYDSYSSSSVKLLPNDEYNQEYDFFNEKIKIRHMVTGRWGLEVRGRIREDQKMNEKMSGIKFKNHKEYMIFDYKNYRGIDLNTFDFYS